MAKKKKGSQPWTWKKSRTGTPKGAPSALKSMARTYQTMLNEPASRVPDIAAVAEDLGLRPRSTTIAAVLSLSHMREAAVGNHHAAKDVADRVDRYLQRGMSRAQLMALAEAIVEIISQEVTDPQTRSNVGERILTLASEFGSDD